MFTCPRCVLLLSTLGNLKYWKWWLNSATLQSMVYTSITMTVRGVKAFPDLPLPHPGLLYYIIGLYYYIIMLCYWVIVIYYHVILLHSAIREVFIKAKYVDTLFVKSLVPPEKSDTLKRWAVAKRQRKTLLLTDSVHGTLLYATLSVAAFSVAVIKCRLCVSATLCYTSMYCLVPHPLLLLASVPLCDCGSPHYLPSPV